MVEVHDVGSAHGGRPGVAGLLVEAHAIGLEVRVLDDEQAIRPRITERPEDGVTLPNEQSSARPQEIGHDLRPAPDARQPAQGADAGIHEIKPVCAEGLDRAVDIPLDKRHLCPRAHRECARLPQSRRREIQTDRRPRSQPRQRDSVSAQMTLQMHDVETVETTESWQVVSHYRGQVGGIVERSEVVTLGADMYGDARLPVSEVDLPPVLRHIANLVGLTWSDSPYSRQLTAGNLGSLFATGPSRTLVRVHDR